MLHHVAAHTFYVAYLVHSPILNRVCLRVVNRIAEVYFQSLQVCCRYTDISVQLHDRVAVSNVAKNVVKQCGMRNESKSSMKHIPETLPHEAMKYPRTRTACSFAQGAA